MIRILYIEDDELDFLALKRQLSRINLDFEITWVSDIQDLENYQPEQFDLVFLDLCIGITRGKETFDAYRKYEFNIPLIIMTGLQDYELGIQLVRMGAEDCLDKNDVPQKNTLRKSIGYALERFKIKKELAEAKDNAQKATRAKSNFLAKMSHEIRTPMNGIMGANQIVLESNLTAEQRKFCTIVDDSAKSLLVILNDILDFSKIENEKLSLESIPVNLKDLCEKTKFIVENLADKKGINFILDLTSDFGYNYFCDPTRYQQIVLNLLTNAIKFTNEGEVRLKVEIRKISDESAMISTAVIDTGIGICEEKCKSIFKPFEQADNSTTREYGGTGLGLPISKSLVELFGGTMQLESEPAKGTTFSFSFELNKASDETINQSIEESEIPDFTGRKVLLCEDIEVNRIIMSSLLSSTACILDCACDGEESLNKLRENTYDLVLMDMQMPKYSGVEVIEQINKEKEGFKTPTIALTANVLEDDRKACLKAGMQEFLSKPVDQNKLFNTMSTYLTNKANR